MAALTSLHSIRLHSQRGPNDSCNVGTFEETQAAKPSAGQLYSQHCLAALHHARLVVNSLWLASFWCSRRVQVASLVACSKVLLRQ